MTVAKSLTNQTIFALQDTLLKGYNPRNAFLPWNFYAPDPHL